MWEIGLTPRFSDEHYAALRLFPKLISVVIGAGIRADSNITDEGVTKLLSMPNISALMLTNLPRISDAIAPDLANSNVRWLCLNCKTITDRSMQHLATMNRLLKLSLIGSSVTRNSMPDLLKLTNLRRLNLTDCDFPADDVERLRLELPRCTVVAPHDAV